MEENYDFIDFQANRSRYNPIISLGEASGFGVSTPFVKKFKISDSIGVKLMYDKKKNAVGIKFLTNKEDGMISFKVNKDSGGGYINANSFLANFDIDRKKFHGRYTPKEVINASGEKIYVIELKENEKNKKAESP